MSYEVCRLPLAKLYKLDYIIHIPRRMKDSQKGPQ